MSSVLFLSVSLLPVAVAPADNGACCVFDIVNDGALNEADIAAFVDGLSGP